MKTKALSILLIILSLPAMLGMFFMLFISSDYLIGGGSQAMAFVLGHSNNVFIAILAVLTLLFMTTMLMYLLQMIKYGPKIDKLEEEQLAYREAREKYERAVKKLSNEFLKNITK